MDSRQQFEENMRTKQKFEDGDFRIVSNGRYYWGTTQFAWEVWSESRESLVVDLGSMTNNGYEGFYPENQIKRALRDSGIRTK